MPDSQASFDTLLYRWKWGEASIYRKLKGKVCVDSSALSSLTPHISTFSDMVELGKKSFPGNFSKTASNISLAVILLPLITVQQCLLYEADTQVLRL